MSYSEHYSDSHYSDYDTTGRYEMNHEMTFADVSDPTSVCFPGTHLASRTEYGTRCPQCGIDLEREGENGQFSDQEWLALLADESGQSGQEL